MFHAIVVIFVHLLSRSFHAHTVQVDTARVEKQTFVCTDRKWDAVPSPRPGVVPKLGNWKSPQDMDVELKEKFKGCMKGRLMDLTCFEERERVVVRVCHSVCVRERRKARVCE